MTPETAWCALSLTISTLGIVGLLACRLTEKSDCSAVCQLLFFAAMLLVAGATLASLALHSGLWVFSGVTLATMAVGGTLHTGSATASDLGR
jgi:hypothetical protein